jgi:mono/diheme cytochrome c family protein
LFNKGISLMLAFNAAKSMPARWPQRLACLFMMLSAIASWAGERPTKGGVLKPEALYHNYCSVCHGDRGDGNSRARNSLVPPPRDFTRAAELTRETMMTIVTHGKPGTAMTAWKTQLEPKEIEAVVDYIRKTFMQVALDPRLQKGRTLYAQNCMVCHGDRGQGASGAAGLIPARDFTTPQARIELTRERMIGSVTNGRANTAMAAFAGRMPAQDIEAVVDFVRASLMLPASDAISGTNAHAGRSGPASIENTMANPFQNGLQGNASKGEKPTWPTAPPAMVPRVTARDHAPISSILNPAISSPPLSARPSIDRPFSPPSPMDAWVLKCQPGARYSTRRRSPTLANSYSSAL